MSYSLHYCMCTTEPSPNCNLWAPAQPKWKYRLCAHLALNPLTKESWQAKNVKELDLSLVFLLYFSATAACASFPRNVIISVSLQFCFAFHSRVF